MGARLMRVIKGIKKWGLLLVIILLAGCSNDNTELTPEEAAQDVIDLLRADKYQTVYDDWFDGDLQHSLAQNELKRDWELLIETSGEFVEVRSLQSDKRGEDLNIIEATIEYTNVIFDVRMIFNAKQQLVGFSMSDGEANVSLPDSIVEEEIVVGEGTDYGLGGTLTLPKGNQEKLPAVVLVQGSGPSDRDESVFAYKPFRDIAWNLAEQGIAVIRYDKRTFTHGEKLADKIGSKLTVCEETVEDAILATELLKNDNRIDEGNVYLIGHSLGGMLAPRIDAQGGDFAGLIILAGSPRSLWEIVYDQNKQAIENEIEDEAVKKEQVALVEKEYEKAQKLQDMIDEEAQGLTVFGMPGYYLKEMEQYDVASIVRELEKPLLIMQGEDDFQVYYEKDFKVWQELLKDSENVTLISYPNLNHFFINYEGPNKGTVAEYETPNQVDTKAIEDIAQWILEQKN